VSIEENEFAPSELGCNNPSKALFSHYISALLGNRGRLGFDGMSETAGCMWWFARNHLKNRANQNTWRV